MSAQGVCAIEQVVAVVVYAISAVLGSSWCDGCLGVVAVGSAAGDVLEAVLVGVPHKAFVHHFVAVVVDLVAQFRRTLEDLRVAVVAVAIAGSQAVTIKIWCVIGNGAAVLVNAVADLDVAGVVVGILIVTVVATTG